MSTIQKGVKEFMQGFGQDLPESPTIPDKKTREFRAKLILEECLETIQALGFKVVVEDSEEIGIILGEAQGGKNPFFFEDYEPDLIGIADGCADIAFVTEGAALACGIDTYEIHNTVAVNNMTKFWKEEELKAMPEGAVSNRASDGLYCVKLNQKVIKSPSYVPVDLKPLVEKQKKN